VEVKRALCAWLRSAGRKLTRCRDKDLRSNTAKWPASTVNTGRGVSAIGLHRNRPPRSSADTYGPDQRRLTPAPPRLWFFNLIQRRRPLGAAAVREVWKSGCSRCTLIQSALCKSETSKRAAYDKDSTPVDKYIVRLSGEKWREREREREDPCHRNCLHNYHRPQQPACICFRGCETDESVMTTYRQHARPHKGSFTRMVTALRWSQYGWPAVDHPGRFHSQLLQRSTAAAV